MGMTIEQAIENAAGFQRQMDEADEKLKTISTGSSLWRQIFSAKSEAKIMLEWYQGYEQKDSHGNTCRFSGLIQKLANEAQRLKESSNLGERFSNRTFGNFDPRHDQAAFNACRDYANNNNLFRVKRNSMLLMGGTGSGKTHLAAAVANTLTDRGVPTLFGTYSEHLERIKEEFDHTGMKEYLSKLKNTPMIVLDDIGKERRTEWSMSVLFDIVNYRYEHYLPIIITTNYDLDTFANYVGSAIFSRLYEMSVAIATAGKDYRQR